MSVSDLRSRCCETAERFGSDHLFCLFSLLSPHLTSAAATFRMKKEEKDLIYITDFLGGQKQ